MFARFLVILLLSLVLFRPRLCFVFVSFASTVPPDSGFFDRLPVTIIFDPSLRRIHLVETLQAMASRETAVRWKREEELKVHFNRRESTNPSPMERIIEPYPPVLWFALMGGRQRRET